MTQWRLYLSGVVLLAGAFAAWSGFRHLDGRTEMSQRPDVERDPGVMRAGASAEPMVLDVVAMAASASVSRSFGSEGEMPAARELARSVEDTLVAYAAPDPTDFDAMLVRQGSLPRPVVHEQYHRMRWDDSRAVMVASSFDPDRIRVIHSSRFGTYEVEPRANFGSVIRRADDRKPVLQKPGADAFDRVELVLPGTIVAVDGTEFEGTLVLEFTHDPETDLWAVTENRVLDVPIRVPVPALPL